MLPFRFSEACRAGQGAEDGQRDAPISQVPAMKGGSGGSLE